MASFSRSLRYIYLGIALIVVLIGGGFYVFKASLMERPPVITLIQHDIALPNDGGDRSFASHLPSLPQFPSSQPQMPSLPSVTH